jgi:hypothetical protein
LHFLIGVVELVSRKARILAAGIVPGAGRELMRAVLIAPWQVLVVATHRNKDKDSAFCVVAGDTNLVEYPLPESLAKTRGGALDVCLAGSHEPGRARDAKQTRVLLGLSAQVE